jgi:hypothetical protein
VEECVRHPDVIVCCPVSSVTLRFFFSEMVLFLQSVHFMLHFCNYFTITRRGTHDGSIFICSGKHSKIGLKPATTLTHERAPVRNLKSTPVADSADTNVKKHQCAGLADVSGPPLIVFIFSGRLLMSMARSVARSKNSETY